MNLVTQLDRRHKNPTRQISSSASTSREPGRAGPCFSDLFAPGMDLDATFWHVVPPGLAPARAVDGPGVYPSCALWLSPPIMG
ncbi:hypothetical protein GCM10018952_29310 [Streptosporangium vulgare]